MCQKEKAKRSRKCIEKKSRNISKEKENRRRRARKRCCRVSNCMRCGSFKAMVKFHCVEQRNKQYWEYFVWLNSQLLLWMKFVEGEREDFETCHLLYQQEPCCHSMNNWWMCQNHYFGCTLHHHSVHRSKRNKERNKEIVYTEWKSKTYSMKEHEREKKVFE